MLDQQGVALRSATIDVHSITPSMSPEAEDVEEEWEDDFDEEEESDEDEDLLTEVAHDDRSLIDSEMDADPIFNEVMYDGLRDWLFIDMTVYPALRAGETATEYQPWHAGVVTLHGTEVKLPVADLDGVFGRMADTRCVVYEVDVWQGEEWLGSDEVEVVGPQRIRLLAGVQPGLRRLDVMYFTEKIGSITLPEN